MTKPRLLARIETGVRNFDDLVNGGLPKGSVIVVGGPPGAGKTILTEQICFHNATAEHRVRYFSTLSEPTAKALRYLRQFRFFDPKHRRHRQLQGLQRSVRRQPVSRFGVEETVVDGVILLTSTEEAFDRQRYLEVYKLRNTAHLKGRHSMSIGPGGIEVVLDSVSQLVSTGEVPEDLRQLLQVLVARFKALGVTRKFTLESSSMYSTDTVTDRGYSPITDNLLMLRYRQVAGELRPTLCMVKTRGSSHDRGTYDYSISRGGIRIGARAIDGASSKRRGLARGRTKR